MKPPRIQQVGSYIRLAWEEISLTATLERVKAHTERVTAEVTFADVRDDGRMVHLWGPEAVNLLSSTAKTNMRRTLGKYRPDLTAPGPNEISPCDEVVERLCFFSLLKVREGSPVQELGLGEDLPPMEWRMEHLLPAHEPTLWFGDGDTGKSILAQAVGLCIQHGLDDLGFTPVQGNVLYLDWETSFQMVDRRTKMIKAGLGYPSGASMRYRHCFQSLSGDIATIHKLVADHGIDYLIIDSLAGAAGGDIQREEQVISFFNSLRSLGCGSLIIHHISKTEPSKPYGNTYIRNFVRSAFDLRRPPEAESSTEWSVNFGHNKSNDSARLPRFGFRLAFSSDMVTIQKGSAKAMPELAAFGSNAERLADALKAGALTTKELYGATGIAEATIRSTMNQRGKGRFVRVVGGKWGLAAQEEAVRSTNT